jgi:DNA relaxase NicK
MKKEKKRKIEYKIDYFRITVHDSTRACIDLYNEHFGLALGKLVDQGHGSYGFKGVMESSLGFQLKHTPGGDRHYCTFEFPGEACKAVPPKFFIYFYKTLVRHEYKINITRIDFAFDNVPFTPKDFKEAIEEDILHPDKNIIRSLTQRKSLHWHSEPFQEREDGSGIGKDTCYFGSRSSERFLRVYNKRGPTRLEIEFKGVRALEVAHYLFMTGIDDWFESMIGQVLDFIDIEKPWWKEFVGDHERAYVTLHSAKDKSLEKTQEWLIHQVSPALAAAAECTKGQIITEMMEEGRKRMHKSYGNLLSLGKMND